jgi:prephenate dehydratase
VRVAFLGPEGTFSEEALLASALADQVTPAPEPTIHDSVVAVQEGSVDRALVPIENSTEGSIGTTLDTLVFEADRVRIVGELVHPIRHCLIARRPLELDEIERVVSHPQPAGQCARFLRDRLAGVEVVSAASTADAVKVVAGSDRPWAALGTALAARLYECVVLQSGVEDEAGNETRFVWLAGDAAESSAESHDGDWKTSIVFWGLPDSPGALAAALKEIADRGVNLSKIESRPLKQGLGNYMFFADLAGAEHDRPVEQALDAIRATAKTLRVLGSYPAA